MDIAVEKNCKMAFKVKIMLLMFLASCHRRNPAVAFFEFVVWALLELSMSSIRAKYMVSLLML